jgi:zinc protease
VNRAFVFLLLLLLAACAGSSQSDAVFVRASLKSTRFRLANGLDVVLHPDAAFRTAHINVRYDVGSRHDPVQRTGLAHLVEHLTFRSKPNGKADAFALLEEVGGLDVNASTNADATTYYVTVPAEALPLALFVEAARMARPLDSVDDASFAVERDVVKNERRERLDNVAYGNLDDVAIFALYEGAYGLATIGIAEDLDRLTLTDAQTFVQEHYRPNNATLVIAGGFDPGRATELVHSLFDSIPARAIGKKGLLPPARSRASGSEIVNVYRAMDVAADAPAVAIAWSVPAPGEIGFREMELAAVMIGHRTRAKLREKIRRLRTRLITHDHASVFLIHAELAVNASTRELVSEVQDDIEFIAANPGEEIGLAKTTWITNNALYLESLKTRASTIQASLAHYDNPNTLQAELHEVSATRGDVLGLRITEYLRSGRRAIAVARPNSKAPKAGAWPGTAIKEL